MPRIPTRCVQPFVYLITTVALALLFASCDQAGLAPTPEAPAGAASETLTFTPMPNGASLLEPGASPAAKQSGASPYGCYLASRPYTDEVQFRSVYLHFPDDIVDAANGETEPFTRRVAASPDGSVSGEKGLRYMNCVIPKTPDANELVTDQLLRAGMEDAARDAFQEAGSTSSATKEGASCFTIVTYEFTCVGSQSDPYQVCNLDRVVEEEMCGGSSGGDVTEVSFEWPDDSGGGSGDSGGGSGGDCTQINPPPGSECTTPSADIPASKAEVDNLIRQTCVGSSLPSGDLGEYFQASVRQSINAWAYPPYQQDAPGGQSSNHPQITNAVDGYAEGLRYAGSNQFVPGYVTSILETKFAENPSNALDGPQYRTHFDDLARIYQQKPEGTDLYGLPSYILVTNSTFSSAQDLGSSYRYNDMVAEAQARNINVFHFRVVKDGGDDFYLEGEALADSFATGVTNWLRDILNINQVPFQVSCTPEP